MANMVNLEGMGLGYQRENDTVENMDEAWAKVLRRRCEAQTVETAQREADAKAHEQTAAGRKLLEQGRNERFMQAFGFFLEMSRYHQAVQEESAAVKRQAEAEANERDYYRDRGIAQPGNPYAGYSVERPSRLGNSLDALRARLTGGW